MHQMNQDYAATFSVQRADNRFSSYNLFNSFKSKSSRNSYLDDSRNDY